MKRLFTNATFVPMTEEDAEADALVAADDGTIAYIGDEEKARHVADGAPETDLNGATVLPGFIDPHGHFSETVQYIVYADLSGCRSFDDIIAKMREFLEEHPQDADGAVMGGGYDHNALAEGRHPDRHVLDQVSADIPVMVVHSSNHMAAANTFALKLAEVTAETPDPEGAHFGREENGEPSGYLEEPNAMFVLYDVTKPRIDMRIAPIADEMQRIYLEHGITTCQDGATYKRVAEQLCDVADAGGFAMDIVSYPMHGEDIDGLFADREAFVGPHYRGRFRFGGVKMFLDGSPQGKTAWMTEPYVEGPNGESDWVAYGTMTDEEVLAFARKTVDENRQLLAHANGDAASDQLLNAYAAAADASDNPRKRELRPVMIHCQTARRDQYERMAELGMIPSIFASHIWYWGDIHLRNFGPERGGRISACGDAVRSGLSFTLHTDTPVIRPNLIEEVWCAVNRMTKSGAFLDEDQRVTPFEALSAITKNSAYQYGEEDHKGTLEQGKLADLVVLDGNPLRVDPADIRRIGVVATIKEGDTIYER